MANKTSFGLHLTTRASTLMSQGDPNITHAMTHGSVLQLAEIADQERIFSSVWIGDNIIVAPRIGFLSAISAVAARTKRVMLGTSCLSSFALWHPIMLALEWASLDLISSGRTIMVPCLGNSPTASGGEKNKALWEAFGIDSKERIGRFEEGIEVIRGLWTHDEFSYDGKYYKLKDVNLMVKPLQTPPPIWIANHPVHITDKKVAERSARRLARLADGWVVADSPPDEFVEWRDWILKLGKEEYQRDLSHFQTCFVARFNIKSNKESAFKEGATFGSQYMRYEYTPRRAERYLYLHGDADDIIKGIEKILEVQPTYIDLQAAGVDQMSQFRKLMSDVLPSFS